MELTVRAGIGIVATLLAAAAPLSADVKARPVEKRAAYSLPNGLRVRLVPDRAAREVVVLLGVRGGFFAEPAGRPHLAHVAEHLVTFGASNGTEDAKAVARWLDEGRANAETLAHFIYFDLRVRPNELSQAVRVQAARLARPEFTPELLRREVPRMLAEVEHLEQSPLGGTSKFALSAFAQASLHGQSQIPLREATRKLTVADVQNYWSRMARPDEAILEVVGDFETEAARETIAKAFGAIPAESNAPPTGDPLIPRSKSATWDVETRHLLIAWKVPPPTDPGHAALTLAALPLMERLQADPSLTPLTRMPLVTNEVDGLFILNAQVKRDADIKTLEVRLLDQVDRLSGREGIGEAELARSRDWLLSSIRPVALAELPRLPGMPRILVWANLELQAMMREMAWGDLEAYGRRVDAVKLEDVRNAVSRRLERGGAVVVRLEPGH